MNSSLDRTTDTPRTDGIAREVVDAMVGAGALWDHVVPAEFARQLERDLAARALTLRDQMAAACLSAIYVQHTMFTDRAAELAYEQADEMLKAREKHE